MQHTICSHACTVLHECNYFLTYATLRHTNTHFPFSTGWDRPTAVAFFSPWQALRAHAEVKSWQTSGLKQALFGASGLVFFIPDMSCHAWSFSQTCLIQQRKGVFYSPLFYETEVKHLLPQKMNMRWSGNFYMISLHFFLFYFILFF